MAREYIFVGSLENRSEEQLAQEAWEAVQAWQAAKDRGETFQPVIEPAHEGKTAFMAYTDDTEKIVLAVGYAVPVN